MPPFPALPGCYIGILLIKSNLPSRHNANTKKHFQLFIYLAWQKVYLLPRSVTLDSKTRGFQYKFLNRIIYTSKALYKMGIVSSPTCTFCRKSEESLEHLFIHCEIFRNFWLSVTIFFFSFNFFIEENKTLQYRMLEKKKTYKKQIQY